MAISSSTNKRVVVANGATATFEFGFIVNDKSHIQCFLDTQRTQLAGFDVVLNANQQQNPGGSVVFPVGSEPTGDLIILRRVPELQETVFSRFGPFPAKTVEFTFDDLVLISQQLREEIDRCIKVDVTNFPEFDYLFPAYMSGAILKWSDDDPETLENLDITGVLNQAIADSVAAAETQADRSETKADEAAVSAQFLSEYLDEYGPQLEFPLDLGLIEDAFISIEYDLGGLS